MSQENQLKKNNKDFLSVSMLKPKISPTKKHPSIFVSKVATGKLLIGAINNESKYLAIALKNHQILLIIYSLNFTYLDLI